MSASSPGAVDPLVEPLMMAPQLVRLVELLHGPPREVVRRLLVLVCEQLGMDLAFVGTIEPDGSRTIRLAVHADGSEVDDATGRSEPLEVTWCARVVAGGTALIDCGDDDEELQALPVTGTFGIRSYAGTTLVEPGGEVVGTLCALGHAAHPGLQERDAGVLRGLAAVIAPYVPQLRGESPARRRSGLTLSRLQQVARELDGTDGLEQTSRALLVALQEITGLGSTYLAEIAPDESVQTVRFAHNTRDGFALQEGLTVPYEETLCRRALLQQRPAVEDVPAVWGDLPAVTDLGLQSYVSVPVELPDGRIWGTLCAADSERATDLAAHLPTMRMFARLVAGQLSREEELSRAHERADLARLEADTDHLTGCGSRRVVEPWLARELAACADDERVMVVYADVDRFKDVNDRLGHAAGDEVLRELGRRLRAQSRPQDLVARLGGDEFVLAARLPAAAVEEVASRVRVALDAPGLSTGAHDVPGLGVSVGHVVAAPGSDAAEALAHADRAMYARKAARAR